MCAGRSDFIQATLPRSIKRMLALSPLCADPHQMAIMRKIFIEAHAHQRNFRTKQHHDEFDKVDKFVEEVGEQFLSVLVDNVAVDVGVVLSREEKIKESRERQGN
jgi:hypothetical protein